MADEAKNGKADLLTSTAVAHLMGCAPETLIGWIDDVESGKPGTRKRRNVRDLPPHIVTPSHHYRFRPAAVEKWLDEKSYPVPASLRERAAAERDAAARAEPAGKGGGA